MCDHMSVSFVLAYLQLEIESESTFSRRMSSQCEQVYASMSNIIWMLNVHEQCENNKKKYLHEKKMKNWENTSSFALSIVSVWINSEYVCLYVHFPHLIACLTLTLCYKSLVSFRLCVDYLTRGWIALFYCACYVWQIE